MAVELRLCEKSRRLAENLVGAPQFLDFALELLEALTFLRRQAKSLAGVSLDLSLPVPQRLVVHLNFAAIEPIAAHCDSYCQALSKTIRTA